jgi:hypothetical protein
MGSMRNQYNKNKGLTQQEFNPAINSFAYYYFDIETVPLVQFMENDQASFDPSKSKIISIQYQQLDTKDGNPISDLTILKEWQSCSSEETIVRKFKQVYIDNGQWSFIPVGNNLLYECRFLKYKLKQYCNLDHLHLGHRPMIDLKHILIILNGGRFKGCAEFLGKTGKARNMAQWYASKNYDIIEEYIIQEATNFANVYSILKKEIPKLRYQIACVI